MAIWPEISEQAKATADELRAALQPHLFSKYAAVRMHPYTAHWLTVPYFQKNRHVVDVDIRDERRSDRTIPYYMCALQYDDGLKIDIYTDGNIQVGRDFTAAAYLRLTKDLELALGKFFAGRPDA